MDFTGRFKPFPRVPAPRVLSLFSGAGGLDLGFLNAGFRVVASSDIDEACCATLNANSSFFPKRHRVVCKSVVDLRLHDLVENEPIDLMIGGPPCQSFSAAGRRAGGVSGVSDFRGSLFWQYGRLISEAKPKAFVFENVRGLLQANRGRDWSVIRDHLEDLGYTLHFRVLDAASFGVPQHRERLIVVGTEPSATFLFPRPLHGPDSPTNARHVSAREAIADIDDPDEIVPEFPGKYGHLLKDVPPGENYKFFTEEMGHPSPKFAWRSRFSDFLYKAHPDHPVRTIVANQGSCSGPFHWKGRRFSAAEFARLQSFPPDYEFPPSRAVAVKQIGNSVAPRFAFHIARALGQQLFGIPHTLELMEESTALSIDRHKSEKAQQTRKRSLRFSSEPSLFDASGRSLTARGKFHEELRFDNPRTECGRSDSKPKWLDARLKGALSEGEWRLSFEDLGLGRRGGFEFTLSIVFGRPLADRFDRITAHGHLRRADRFSLVWNAIHRLIRKETSFDSLHPLYGHFTEPYPKFRTSFAGKDRSQPELIRLYERLTDFSFSQHVRPLGELTGLTTSRDPLSGVRELRSLGWDFRVHQTNRSIPEGKFRCCYPFAMPIDAATFVAWVEVGDHRTADLTSIGASPD